MKSEPYSVRGNKGVKNTPFVKHFKTAEKRSAWVEKNSDNIGNLSFADPIEWPEEPMADMDYRRGSRQANHRSPFGPM